MRQRWKDIQEGQAKLNFLKDTYAELKKAEEQGFNLSMARDMALGDFMVERDKGIGVNPNITTQTEKDKVMDQIGRSDKEHVNELKWKIHQLHQRHIQWAKEFLG